MTPREYRFYIFVSIVLLCVITAAVAQEIDALPGEPDVPPTAPKAALSVRAGEGSPILAIDIFAAAANEQVKQARWYAKPFVAVAEAAKAFPQDVARHPIQWTVAGLATWEAIDSGVSDLIQDAFGTGGSTGRKPKPAVANTAADITIAGDNNTLRDVAQTKDVSISGDNNTVDFQRIE